MYKKTGLGLFIISLCLPVTLLADSLVEIYDMAKKNDAEFRAAKSSLEADKEFLNQSTANFLPSLKFNTTANYSDADKTYIDPITSQIIIPDDTTTTYGLTLNIPLYNYSNFTTSSINESFVSQSEANFAQAELDLVIRVADRYFDVLSAFDNLEFAEAEKESIARQLDQTKQRFDVGLVAITDVHEAQARFDSASAETIAAESALNGTLESLRELTGSYPAELNGLKENAPLVTPEPNDIDAWTEMALKQNLNIIATQYAVEQARESVKAQRAGYHPSINASASVNDSDVENSESTTTASLTFSWSIWEGGRTNSQVRQANHNLTSSLESLEQTRRATQRSVRKAFLDVISGISRIKALKQAVVSNDSALKASEAGFEVGTRTTVDVLLTRQGLFNARRNLSQAKYQYITDTLRLKRAAGQLSKNDLDGINQWLE